MPSSSELKEYAARRRELMKRIGPDAVAIVPASAEVVRSRDTHYRFRQNSDFHYLTGFGEPEAILVLAPGRKNEEGRKAETLLFVRPRDKQREIWDGRRAGPEGAVADYGLDEAFNLAEMDEQLPKLLSGRETVHYTLGEFVELDQRLTASVRMLRETSRRGASAPGTFVALDSTLHEMRLFKRPAELAIMRRATEVSAHAHVRAMRATAPGANEWQIAAEIHAEFELNDLQPGYGTICGGGANACILHYTENNAPLQDGDLLLIDAGGEYRGYTADITRTFPVNGQFSPEQKAVYEIVLAANKAAIKTLKPGVSVGKPHEVATKVLTEGLIELGILQGKARQLIKDNQQKAYYMHGTGHWLGMDVHDVGRYKLQGEFRHFEPGMIMTVEPGLYFSPGSEGVDPRYWGIGIRIEDDVLVTDHGPEVLTQRVPKEVADLERVVGAG